MRRWLKRLFVLGLVGILADVLLGILILPIYFYPDYFGGWQVILKVGTLGALFGVFPALLIYGLTRNVPWQKRLIYCLLPIVIAADAAIFVNKYYFLTF